MTSPAAKMSSQSQHLPARVDFDEAVLVAGDAGKPGTVEHRQCHDEVGGDLLAAAQDEAPWLDPECVRAGVQRDAPRLQHRRDRRGGGRTEQLERALLGRRRATRTPSSPALAGVRRPSVQARRRVGAETCPEGIAKAIEPAVPLMKSSTIAAAPARRCGRGRSERRAARPGRRRRSPARASRRGRAHLRLWPRLAPPHTRVRSSSRGSDRRVARRGSGQDRNCVPTAIVRLADGDRAVEELAIGRDQRDLDPVTGKLTQGQQRLESRHPAAGDDDASGARPDRFRPATHTPIGTGGCEAGGCGPTGAAADRGSTSSGHAQ